MVRRRERLVVVVAEDGAWVRAFWRRVLIVSSGYSEQSTVRPATAPDCGQVQYWVWLVWGRGLHTSRDLVHKEETSGSSLGCVDIVVALDKVYRAGILDMEVVEEVERVSGKEVKLRGSVGLNSAISGSRQILGEL
jgi:hypothetical protein